MFRPSRARGVLLLVAFSVLTSAATAHAQSAWVLWEHSYEVWIDTNKDSHRRDVAWKKVTATAAKSDCDDRTVREARAEYYTLTGQGVGATLAGSQVGALRGIRDMLANQGSQRSWVAREKDPDPERTLTSAARPALGPGALRRGQQ